MWINLEGRLLSYTVYTIMIKGRQTQNEVFYSTDENLEVSIISW